MLLNQYQAKLQTFTQNLFLETLFSQEHFFSTRPDLMLLTHFSHILWDSQHEQLSGRRLVGVFALPPPSRRCRSRWSRRSPSSPSAPASSPSACLGSLPLGSVSSPTVVTLPSTSASFLPIPAVLPPASLFLAASVPFCRVLPASVLRG